MCRHPATNDPILREDRADATGVISGVKTTAVGVALQQFPGQLRIVGVLPADGILVQPSFTPRLHGAADVTLAILSRKSLAKEPHGIPQALTNQTPAELTLGWTTHE